MKKRTRTFKIIMGVLSVLVLAGIVGCCVYLFSYHEVGRDDMYYFMEENEGSRYGVQIKFTKDKPLHSAEIGTVYCGNGERKVKIKVHAEVAGGTLHMVIGTPDMITGTGEWQISSESEVYVRRAYTEDTVESIDLSEYTGELKIAFYVDNADYEQFVVYQEQEWLKGYAILGNGLYDRFGIDWLADGETKKRPPKCNTEEYIKYQGEVLDSYLERMNNASK